MATHKTESVKIRMAPKQKEMLRQVAKAMGLDMSACVIQLVTIAAAKL